MKRLIDNMQATLETVKADGQSFDIYLEATMSTCHTSPNTTRLTHRTFGNVIQTLSHIADSIDVRDNVASDYNNLIIVDYIEGMETVATIRIFKEYNSTIIEFVSVNAYLLTIAEHLNNS